MASTPTDAGHAAPRSPEPLTLASLEAIPGVLGRIARERAADYALEAARTGAAGTGAAGTGTAGTGAAGTGAAAGGVAARPTGPGRFERALRGPGLALIAEVKRSSPSQGAIRDLDPVATARAYVAGGAAAVSVLTEERHFGGRLEHLRAVSAAVGAPTLRKDFVVHPAQVLEAASAGAGAVLLIVAVLGDALGAYLGFARAQGLDALVEVHDEAELERAIAAGAGLIGVNNRDLRSLAIDPATAPRLIELGRSWGATATWVAESGYADASDLDAVRGLADAVLVGTSLARAQDVAAAVRALLGSPVPYERS